MQTGSTPRGPITTEKQIYSGLKILETEVKVDKPIFKEVTVEVPKYIERPMEVSTELDTFSQKVGTIIADTAMRHILEKLEGKLDQAISARIKTIEVPKIIEKEEVRIKEVEVEKEILKPVIREVEVVHANIKEVSVDKPVYKDIEILKPIIEDIAVKNAVIEDVLVHNAVVENVPVVNAIIKHQTVKVTNIIEEGK